MEEAVDSDDPASSAKRTRTLLNIGAATESTLGSLVLGLGAVTLVVGGLGVANTMIVSVLERRVEIGVRRALGARKRHIGGQFLAESMLVSVGGGLFGTGIGVLIVAILSIVKEWPLDMPWYGVVGPIVGALAVGMIAGLYPALRAAQVTPSEVLRAV